MEQPLCQPGRHQGPWQSASSDEIVTPAPARRYTDGGPAVMRAGNIVRIDEVSFFTGRTRGHRIGIDAFAEAQRYFDGMAGTAR